MTSLRVHVQKSVGKPDAGDLHVRFDERGTETGRAVSSAPAPFLDSTPHVIVTDKNAQLRGSHDRTSGFVSFAVESSANAITAAV